MNHKYLFSIGTLLLISILIIFNCVLYSYSQEISNKNKTTNQQTSGESKTEKSIDQEKPVNTDNLEEIPKDQQGFLINEVEDYNDNKEPITNTDNKATIPKKDYSGETEIKVRKDRITYNGKSLIYIGSTSKVDAVARTIDVGIAVEMVASKAIAKKQKKVDTDISKQGDDLVISVNNEKIVAVNDDDAKVNNVPKEVLARIWKKNIDKAIEDYIKRYKAPSFDELLNAWLTGFLIFIGLILVAEILRIVLCKFMINLVTAGINICNKLVKHFNKLETDSQQAEYNKKMKEKIVIISNQTNQMLNLVIRIIQSCFGILLLIYILYFIPETNPFIRSTAHYIIGAIILFISDFMEWAFSEGTWRSFINATLFIFTVGVVIYVIQIVESVILNVIFITFNDLKGKGKRFQTITIIICATIQIVIIFFSLFIMMHLLNINMAPLIAGASIAGVSLSIGAQNLLKDIINGIFILFEDQFGIGDIIKIDQATGVVEDMSLRITAIRDLSGVVHIIPNSQITKVSVYTKDWARAHMDITIPDNQDIDESIRIIKSVAEDMCKEFPDKIISKPKVLGVDNIHDKTVDIKLIMDTVAGEQWSVEREYKRRIKYALEQGDIKDGVVKESGNNDIG